MQLEGIYNITRERIIFEKKVVGSIKTINTINGIYKNLENIIDKLDKYYTQFTNNIESYVKKKESELDDSGIYRLSQYVSEYTKIALKMKTETLSAIAYCQKNNDLTAKYISQGKE